MNDFTKEELEWLEEELAYIFQDFQQPQIAYDIHRKIQSMIDKFDLIKIEKRKCPLCSSDFAPLYQEDGKIITPCANLNCTYFYGFKL